MDLSTILGIAIIALAIGAALYFGKILLRAAVVVVAVLLIAGFMFSDAEDLPGVIKDGLDIVGSSDEASELGQAVVDVAKEVDWSGLTEKTASYIKQTITVLSDDTISNVLDKIENGEAGNLEEYAEQVREELTALGASEEDITSIVDQIKSGESAN